MSFISSSDFHDAFRGLRRAPTLVAAAVICLGLGIGVTAAVSSAVDRALLRPPPYRDPGRLVTVYRTAPNANSWPHSAPNYLDLRRQTHQLSALAAGTWTTGIVGVNGESLKPSLFRVTGNLFPMLGVRALYGRLFTPADDSAGAPDVAVLSETFWREHLGGDPSAVGRTIRVQGRPFTVIGILPRDFRFIQGTRELAEDVWLPMRFTDRELGGRYSNFLMLVGRLAPHATAATAQTELVALFDGLIATYPSLRSESIRVVPLQAESVRAVRTPLLLVFGAVCMVLLIAVSNVGGLLLARGVQRRREIAVRAALGGSRWAVVRPVLAESVLLSALGLAAGFALAWAGVHTIGALAERQIPQLHDLHLDYRVALFAVGLGLIAALVCGVLPAWRSSSVDPQEALRAGRGGGTDRGHHRLLGGLVIAEVALSLVLLIGASLVLRGFVSVLRSDPGFDASRMLALDVSVAPTAYPDTDEVRRFLHPVLNAIAGIPGVAAAGVIDALPYVTWGDNFNIRYEGVPGDNPSKLPLVEYREATAGFFATTQQRLVAGRLFGPADYQKPGAPAVVVVNEALVKRDFKGRTPIGTRFHSGDSDTSYATIVGVVSDIHNYGPYEPAHPEAYFSVDQSDPGSTGASIVVRVKSGNPTAVAAAVRLAVHRVDPGAAIGRLEPMDQIIAKSVGQPRFYLILLGAFAVVAVLLTVAGLYGVMSYTVAQRTREIGIRSALGSPAGRIVGLVTRQGAVLVGAGLALGLLGGVATTRLLRGLLYGVSAGDPTAWLGAAAAIAVAGVAACLVPAVRAARVDPLIAMQVE
ncbi:MAG: ABC transporter permease [Gemmatimonadaceae bacterium]